MLVSDHFCLVFEELRHPLRSKKRSNRLILLPNQFNHLLMKSLLKLLTFSLTTLCAKVIDIELVLIDLEEVFESDFYKLPLLIERLNCLIDILPLLEDLDASPVSLFNSFL